MTQKFQDAFDILVEINFWRNTFFTPNQTCSEIEED
jgi:hypothetical protein